MRAATGCLTVYITNSNLLIVTCTLALPVGDVKQSEMDMKLIVFGATGGTGRHLLEQALAEGHVVTAFVRNPSKLGLTATNLRLVAGDVMDPAAVEQAMPGHDAVLVMLGAPARSKGLLRSEGTRNIIRAMEKAGVRRLICQTSLGYADSRQVLERTAFHFRYIVAPLFLRGVFADHERQEDLIKQSNLDWTIVRPGNLTDGLRTGRYRHGFAADDKLVTVKISRADVAEFMLRQLRDDTYLRKTPGLSY
jgi:putative NADH-flavin reductase